MSDIKVYNITRPSYNMAILNHRYAMMRDGTFVDLQTEMGMKVGDMVHIDDFVVTARSVTKRVFHKDNPKTLTLPLKRRANKLLEEDKADVHSKLYLPYEMYKEYHDVHMTTYSRLRIEHGFSCSKKISEDLPAECDIYGMKGLRYEDTCLYMTQCGMVFSKHTEGFKYKRWNNPKKELRYLKDGRYRSVLYKKVKEATWGEI